MVHVYNVVANQDLQRKKSLKCKPVDIPVFFWRSVDNIIMVLTKSQNILITSSYLIALLELLTVLLEYIDLFLSKTFSHIGFSIFQLFCQWRSQENFFTKAKSIH